MLVKYRRKDAGGVMIGKTKPVNRPVQPHQGCCVHVANETIVLDWLICHEATPYIVLFSYTVTFGIELTITTSTSFHGLVIFGNTTQILYSRQQSQHQHCSNHETNAAVNSASFPLYTLIPLAPVFVT